MITNEERDKRDVAVGLLSSVEIRGGEVGSRYLLSY